MRPSFVCARRSRCPCRTPPRVKLSHYDSPSSARALPMTPHAPTRREGMYKIAVYKDESGALHRRPNPTYLTTYRRSQELFGRVDLR